jgi:hypothetical protein
MSSFRLILLKLQSQPANSSSSNDLGDPVPATGATILLPPARTEREQVARSPGRELKRTRS